MTHPNAMPCRINGKLYPSQVAAAYDLGVTPNTISQAIRHGREDRVALPHRGMLGNRNAGRPVCLFGLAFPSRKDAAAAFGMSRNRFSRLLNAGTPAAMEALLAARMRMDAAETRKALKAAEMVDGPSLGAYRAGGRKGGLLNRREAA